MMMESNYIKTRLYLKREIAEAVVFALSNAITGPSFYLFKCLIKNEVGGQVVCWYVTTEKEQSKNSTLVMKVWDGKPM